MKKSFVLYGSALAILLAVLLATNPTHLPSYALVLPFGLLFISIYGMVRMGLQLVGIDGPKQRRFAILVASAPSALLLLQSIGQLTLRDVAAIIGLAGIAYFYVTRLALTD